MSSSGRGSSVGRSALIAVALIAGGCGIPMESEPRALPPEVEADSPSTGDSPATPDSGTTQAFVWYWTDADRLMPIARRVSSKDPETMINLALAAPTDVDRAVGVSSRIPEGTNLLGVPTAKDGVLAVDLSGTLDQIRADAQRQAIAQIVLTADQIAGVDTVEFSVDGTPLRFAAADGQQAAASSCDFRTSLATPEDAETARRSSSEVEALTNRVRTLDVLCTN